IQKQIQQLPFQSYHQLKTPPHLTPQKHQIQTQINIYNNNYQTYQIHINTLKEFVKPKKLLNLQELPQSIQKTNFK
ncbi:hypothetical protein, partial [Staphylococcus epidermidis]|uniref:hypothetical protein n=1 Tax=Staphylococcus epidermidis TaxID=1282 RepID=UPI001C9301A3